MLRSARRLSPVLLVVALVLCAPAGGARGPKMHKISAHFVYVSDNTNGCTWGIGVEFPRVNGATGYLVKYFDGYYGRLIETTVAPSQLQSDPKAGKGTYLLGVTGGGYSPPCDDSAGDPTENGRFKKGATAFAILPPEKRVIAGNIFKQCPAKCSASAKPGLQGVSVVAKGRSRGRAITGPDGDYEMAVPKGKYTVTPSLKGFSFDPETKKVDANANVRNVDFRACDGSKTRAIPVPNFCLGTVQGDLLNHDGGGIEEFPVVITGRTTAGRAVSERAITDHKGHYEIHLPDGKYTIDLSDSVASNLWRPSDKRNVTLSGTEAGGNFVTTAACGNGGRGGSILVTRMGTSGRDVMNVGLFEAAPRVVALLGDGNDVFHDLRTPAIVCTGEGADDVTLGGFDDSVENTSGDDDVDLGAGDDLFRGSGDNEKVDAGPGNDDINTFGGEDRVFGGDGNDGILVGAGNDVVDAGPGKDAVDGYTGNDTLTLGAGPNFGVDGGPGHDSCFLAPVDPKTIARDCETVRVDNGRSVAP